VVREAEVVKSVGRVGLRVAPEAEAMVVVAMGVAATEVARVVAQAVVLVAAMVAAATVAAWVAARGLLRAAGRPALRWAARVFVGAWWSPGGQSSCS